MICRGRPDKVQREVLVFDRAADLVVSRTLYQGIPTDKGRSERLKYHFNWLDDKGGSLFTISGSNPPSPFVETFPAEANESHFGTAAERAWTTHLLPEARRQLDRGAAVRFRLHDWVAGYWIEIDQRGLTFHLGRKTERWGAGVLDAVQHDQKKGVARFRHVDAREGWLSSTGVYEVELAKLANADLFFLLLRELHGRALER
jgi:hypothetical protein